MKLKIKSGDTVVVISGEYKGNEGKVLVVDREKNKAIIEGVNMVKKHEKPSAKSPQGGIVEKEAPIHISNLALIENGEPVRVGFEYRDGKKVRVSRKTGEII